MKTVKKQSTAKTKKAPSVSRGNAGLNSAGAAFLDKNVRQLTDASWLEENVARFDRMFAAQQQHQSFGLYVLAELATAVSASHIGIYAFDGDAKHGKFRTTAEHGTQTAGFSVPDEKALRRCAAEKNIVVTASQKTGCQILLPVMTDTATTAIMSANVPESFGASEAKLLQHAASRFGAVLEAMEEDAHTQRLLRQSESLTRELQNQQVWLKHTNDELEDKARLLAVQKIEMETRNREIEQARQALQEKAQQLALTSKYKSEFLANMSHELRTPLNSMLLLARQLMENREQTLTDKQLEFSKVIHAAGQELLHLVNDILDLAKIEAGKISIEIGDYSMAELPEFVERNFQLLAESKNLALNVEFARNVPKIIQTDAQRLDQILKNLLSNALKFTKQGGVTLRVKRVQSGWSKEVRSLNEAPGVIAFCVSDTGIGIAADKQRLIFEAFQQADGGTSREYGGTGLGLTISRELASLLGGEITLQSEAGKGSTFTFYTPETTIAPAPAAHALREPKRKTASEVANNNLALAGQLRGRTALIVDDDIRNIFALTSLLERLQMKVLSAEDGQCALHLLERAPLVDIVLLDIMMPGMDGYAVMSKLRRSERFKKMPIIAVTAQAMKDDREKCLRAGATEYIAKPIDPELLLNALKEILQ